MPQIACTIRYLHSPYVVHGLLLVLCIVSMVDTLKNETLECKDVASTIIVLVFSQMAYFMYCTECTVLSVLYWLAASRTECTIPSVPRGPMCG
jgi:hypothetical protein